MFVLASIYTIFPFSVLITVNEAIVKFWHNTLGFSWGAAIIGLTVTIRLVILPLTFKQVQSMQAMQRLQPELKKLQQRYKDDKKRQQEEMMKFYKEHQVNPFGSCLPLILQLPFFFSLYGLQQSAHFKHEVCAHGGSCSAAHFLFIDNILKPATSGALVALLVLYVATQLGSSIVSATSIQDKNQRRLMFVFPFIFVPVVIRFQAGLLVYWITTNLWTVGQQLVIKRFFPPPTPVAVAGPPVGSAGKTSDGPSSAPAQGGTWGRIMTALQGPAAAATDGSGSAGQSKQPAATKKGSGQKGASSKAGPKQGAARSGTGNGSPQKAPPPSPRKRKKRSGRRR